MSEDDFPDLPAHARPAHTRPAPSKRLSRVRTTFFVLFLLAGAVILLAYHAIGDRTWWGEWLTIWPPVLWAYPLLIVMTLSLDPHRKSRSALSLLLILMFILHAYNLESPHYWKPVPFNPTKGDVRVVTWNVNGAPGGIRALEWHMAQYDADLWLLQESPDPSDVWAGINPARLGWPEVYYHDMGDCAALSRYPMTPLDSKKIGPWDPPQLLHLDLPSSRTLLVANVRLMLPSLRLNPLSRDGRSHMKADHAARLAQFENLAALLAARQKEINADAVILAGDFNTPARMPSLDPLRQMGLGDAWIDAGRGWGPTMTAAYPVARIDQCWTLGAFRPVMAYVNSSDYSDHLPLVVDLSWDSPPSPVE